MPLFDKPRTETHSIMRWLEIEGYEHPVRIVKEMKGYGIWCSGVMTRVRFLDRRDAYIRILFDPSTMNNHEFV